MSLRAMPPAVSAQISSIELHPTLATQHVRSPALHPQSVPLACPCSLSWTGPTRPLPVPSLPPLPRSLRSPTPLPPVRRLATQQRRRWRKHTTRAKVARAVRRTSFSPPPPPQNPQATRPTGGGTACWAPPPATTRCCTRRAPSRPPPPPPPPPPARPLFRQAERERVVEECALEGVL
jgi:hypothetical protein